MKFLMRPKEHFATKKLTSAATVTLVRTATNLFAVNAILVTMVFAKMSKFFALLHHLWSKFDRQKL